MSDLEKLKRNSVDRSPHALNSIGLSIEDASKALAESSLPAVPDEVAGDNSSDNSKD